MNFESLIENLKASGVLQSKNITTAFKKVDRKDFVPEVQKDVAYLDQPISIGHGQTISQPYTVAFMLELLQPEEGDKVLDIGSGSGWTTVLLANCVGEEGNVLGKERIPELVEFAQWNLQKYNLENATIELVEPNKLGVPGKKYDKILVSATSDKVPTELFDQLKSNGRLVVPVDNSIFLFQKNSKGNIISQEYPGFSFVPLITND